MGGRELWLDAQLPIHRLWWTKSAHLAAGGVEHVGLDVFGAVVPEDVLELQPHARLLGRAPAYEATQGPQSFLVTRRDLSYGKPQSKRPRDSDATALATRHSPDGRLRARRPCAHRPERVRVCQLSERGCEWLSGALALVLTARRGA
jgi:hypothetical protein